MPGLSCSGWDLVPWQGMEPGRAPCIGSGETSREVPQAHAFALWLPTLPSPSSTPSSLTNLLDVFVVSGPSSTLDWLCLGRLHFYSRNQRWLICPQTLFLLCVCVCVCVCACACVCVCVRARVCVCVCSMLDLTSPIWDGLCALVVEAPSPNCWTARKFPTNH